tara:strand:+ start:335 stop:739 length:405 start_codon:yes stop_codon:yes gene_type:complete
MKNLIFFLLFFSLAFSQINTDNYIKGQYVEFYTWNEGEKNYLSKDMGSWLEVRIDPFKDYYLVEVDNDGEVDKIWWEHVDEEFDFDSDSYYTKDGRKILFNYDAQEIYFYSDFSDEKDRYLDLMIITKIETFEK